MKPPARAFSFVFTFAFVRDGLVVRRVQSFRASGDGIVCRVAGIEGDCPLEGDCVRVGRHRLLLQQELRVSSGLVAVERGRGRLAPPQGGDRLRGGAAGVAKKKPPL